MAMHHRDLPIDSLVERSDNPNRMSPEMFEKLVKHIERTGRYPAIIVRPLSCTEDERDEYEIIDGHHRIQALRSLGHSTARCDVWEIDDDEALVLLATLNRLSGFDDPLRRADMLQRLTERFGKERLVTLVPEDRERLNRLLGLRSAPPPPQPPTLDNAIPETVTFFLTTTQRRRLDEKLRAAPAGGTRSARLISLLALGDESDS